MNTVNGFAVYGTLRPGEPNDIVWDGLGLVRKGQFYVEGMVLLLPPDWGFPYAIETGDPADRIVVDLVVPMSIEQYEHMLNRFDRLEGYPNHYTRKVVEIKDSETGLVAGNGWIYLIANASWLGEVEVIQGGDWKSVTARKGWFRQ